MYANPFLFGAMTTILVEILALLLYVILNGKRKKINFRNYIQTIWQLNSPALTT